MEVGVEQTSNDNEIEKSNHLLLIRKRSYRIALLSTFSALAVVLGYMLAYLPNIELFTLMIFLSGFILGKREGLIVGLLSASIFTFFNPLGASPPPLFIYQLFHYSLTGLSGGLIKGFLSEKEYFHPREDLYIFRVMVVFGIAAAILTFTYDILSTAIGGLLVSTSVEYLITTYMTGIVFTIVHFIGNILGFVFLLPGLIQLITKLLD